ncbi:MAG: LamG domain-containing protein [Paludibacter sp.]|nr:LamG domain-containing protein [Paludibacter sp.]
MKKKNYFFQIKKLSKLWLISAGLLISAGVFSQDITTGLVLQYDFDAISGTTVPDVSGNNNVGTLMGAAKDTIGYSNKGVKCILKADYVALPSGFTSNITSFSYASWVNLSSLKNATRFFDLGIGADATNNFLAFIPSYNGDNGFMCLRYRPVTGTAQNVISSIKCPVGSWAHIALTYAWDASTSTGVATMYLNGAVVGTGTGLTFNPSLSLGATTNNILGVSRWGQDINGFNGVFDDVRFYNRALSTNDVLTLNGLAELNTQHANLSLGDISAVTSNIALPLTLGTKGVTLKWTTSNKAVIDSLGTVTRPDKYDAPVKLEATLTQMVGDKTYTLTKGFLVIVSAIIPTPLELAQWDFDGNLINNDNGTITVKDTKSGFVGTCVNEAKIRTIGTTQQFNVLDLGNGKGYFDMGTEIGKAIYSLTNYTMCGFFRIDETYAFLNSNGNFYWTFSNTADADKDKNGYIIGSLKGSNQSVATNYYNIGNQATGTGLNATLGGWHHFAFVQKGNTGTTFIDGVQSGENTAMTNLPALTLPKTGLTGTPFNWLGRSNYINDVYLRSTLLYDFRVLSTSLTADDLNFSVLSVPATIEVLNNAYIENPNYILPELATELNNINLGDLSALTSNVTLPTKGTLDPTILISWKTRTPALINATGVVTRPNYYNYNDTLTATLTKNGQQVSKAFPLTVLAKVGTAYNNDLLVKFDFSSVSDSTVTDAAEKHLTGTLRNKAKIHSIGTSVKYNVLSLGDSIGYFDLGSEIGKLMYNLNDYTMSAYYRVDTAYTQLTSNGNFLWNFSNGTNAMSDQNGYVIGSLKDQSVSISPKYYTAASGNQAVSLATVALKGGWHNMTYTQSGTLGTLYVDGMPMTPGSITNLPSTALPKPNQLGTPYNWIGRSCYSGDTYLRKTLVYDFRLYRTALTDEQIQTSVLNVGTTINALEIAYAENPTAVKQLAESPYKVVPISGGIKIIGLNGTEKVSLFDIAGRQMKISTTEFIKANSGVYIVKINNTIAKVLVK